MKTATALLFASVAAAREVAYATVYPGHGKGPVTVTEQFQPVPTWAHGKWSEYEYISTVFSDVWGNKITVTETDQPVTVYHHKTTITHTAGGYGGYAKPTGYWGGHKSNYTAPKTWNELEEEIHVVPYNHIGPHAIPGYTGNPKCTDTKDDQAVTVKKYSGGKWNTYPHTFHYGVPKPSVTTYDKPGTYTIPAQDLTVDKPTALPTVGTTKATANKPCTYGGVTTDVTKPTTITATYGAYQTHGTTTKTVVVTKTVTCNKPGKYTIVKPTTTVYPHDTTITYPTVTKYPPGVYHHSKTTITITKSHQPYTCSYQQTKTYPEPTKKPHSTHPTHKPTSTPGGYPEPTKNSHPTQKSSSSSGGYPEPTKKPHHTKPHHTKPHPTHKPSSSSTPGSYPEPTTKPHHTKPHHTKPHHTKPHHTKTSTAPNPDPSSDYEEPAEAYGHPSAGYVKRGGVLERRKAEEAPRKQAKRVILV